jgi:hypothetical protein
MVMIIFIIYFGSAVIYGIIKYWIEYIRKRRSIKQLYLLELEEREQTKLKLYKDIEFLTAHIGMLEDLQLIIEKDIHNGNGNYKANLSRLISLDKQIHTAQQKVDKLNNKLENL